MKHTLFEATLDENNQFHIQTDIPEGVEITISQANLLDLLGALTEVTFFCAHLQRGAINDVIRGKGLSHNSQQPNAAKEDVH